MKKFLSLAACLTVIASLAIGGTVAYLTDTDSNVNVMTVGNVKIDQIEQQRAGEGKLEGFEQGQGLFPTTAKVKKYIGLDGGVIDNGSISAYKFLADENGKDIPNVVDKIVTVKNTGRADAYVRTIIAFEVAEKVAEVKSAGTHIGLMRNAGDSHDANVEGNGNTDWYWTWLDNPVVIKGQKYAIATVVHKEIVEPNEETIPSLLQIYMKSDADNAYVEKLGNTYDVLVLSQAVQAQGFDDAKTALDAGFGAVTTDTAAEWFGGISVPTTVSTENELTDALADGGSAILTSDIQPTGAIYVTGGTLYGNGNTIDASQVTTSAWPNAYAVTLGNGGSAVDNLKIINAGYAIGSTATTEDIYINNVTIDKVTYAINGNGNNKNSVYVTNSTINGWISYSNVKLLSFDNCKLAKGKSYDGYLVVYGDTSFNNCEFKDFHMCAREQDGKVVAAGDTVSFTNCTYNGEKITAANFKNLFMKTGDDADFNNLKECNVVIDGVKVTW